MGWMPSSGGQGDCLERAQTTYLVLEDWFQDGTCSVSHCFSTYGGRCSGENALLEIFLSKNHIAGSKVNKHLISLLDSSMRKMKHNLSNVPKLTIWGQSWDLVVLNGLSDSKA